LGTLEGKLSPEILTNRHTYNAIWTRDSEVYDVLWPNFPPT